MSVRDVTKQLRTVLSRNSLKDDISSPAAHEPPTELLSIIHACASANSDSISREDQVRLLECLLECATDVADNNSKISMGLVTLAECLQTPIASPSFDQASFLWDVLLRPALAPALSDHSNWTPLTRQASAASKKLALWLLDHEQHQDDVVSLMEKHILQDYCDLAQKAVTSKLSADKSLLALKDILSTAARPRAKVTSVRFLR